MSAEKRPRSANIKDWEELAANKKKQVEPHNRKGRDQSKRKPQNRKGRDQSNRKPQNRKGRDQSNRRPQLDREQPRPDRVQFIDIDQHWSKQCEHCGCIHLQSATPSMLRNCCDNGRLAEGGELEENYKLQSMTEKMHDIMVQGTAHFSRLSSTYNNMFAFGTVCVENDNGGGFEKRIGDHAVTICGRTYSYVPRANSGSADPSGGVSYFTFDIENERALENHINMLQHKALKKRVRLEKEVDEEVAALNRLMRGEPPEERMPPRIVEQEEVSVVRRHDKESQTAIKESIVKTLRDELQRINPICQELKTIGDACRETNYNKEMVQARLLNAVQYFDVAAITSTTNGSRKILIVTHSNQTTKLDMANNCVESLCYPLFFQHGEKGWCDDDTGIISNRHYLASRILKPEMLTKEVAIEDDVEILDWTDQPRMIQFDEEEEYIPFFEDRIIQNHIAEHGVLTAAHLAEIRQRDNQAVEEQAYTYNQCRYMTIRNDDGQVLRTNRFQLNARLMQVYITDQVSRMVDRQIKFVQHNQKLLLCGNSRIKKKNHRYKSRVATHTERESPTEYEHGDANGLDEEIDDTVFLPASLHGSPRHLKCLANNGLAIVSELGSTTVFITLTMNINLQEIKSQLGPRQSAFDRPDIVCQVFHQRLEAFVHNAKHGKYFGGRKFIFDMRSIEYQWRGLPHCHLVGKLADAPDAANRNDCIKFIDEHVHATIPDYIEGDDKNNRIRELVKEHMIHKCVYAECGNGCLNKPANEGGVCKRQYGTGVLVPETHFNDKGFPVYKRPAKKDLNVVPYNPEILLDWNGHVNVEYSETVKRLLYLYSYLYKGSKKTNLLITNMPATDGQRNAQGTAQDVLRRQEQTPIEREREQNKEIKLYLKGRFLCSMDAVWRTFGYHTYPRPNPAVRLIKVKTESMIGYLLQEKKTCDLLLYLLRPEQLQNFLYTEFYKKYVIVKALPARYAQKPHMKDVEYFEVVIDELRDSKYICLRASNDQTAIVRMEMLYVTMGEIYYLRKILEKRPISRSVSSALTDTTGKKWGTLQQSAIADGYIKEHTEALESFREALTVANSPSQLRGYFAIMMIQGYPVKVIYDDEELRLRLMDDYMERNNQNLRLATNCLLEDLQRRLKQENKSLDTFGFPVPVEVDTELDKEIMRHCPIENERLLNELNENEPNNHLQEHYFHKLMHIVKKFQDAKDDSSYIRSKFIALKGSGGCGKTALNKKWHAACRANGVLIKVCAATTLAANIYDYGITAHSLFNFPVVEDVDRDMDEPLKCNLEKDKDKERLECLKATVVIFWDEFFSNHREIFESVVAFFKRHYKTFLFVCSGDPNQIGPVVKNGLLEDVVAASMLSSQLWKHFEIWTLTENMRVKQSLAALNEYSTEEERLQAHRQQAFAESLECMAVNKDSINTVVINEVSESESQLLLPLSRHFFNNQQEEALDWLFDGPITPDKCINCVILAANNKSVDTWNSTIQAFNNENKEILRSRDYLCDVDDPHGILKDLMCTEVLNSYNKKGVPPHELELKVDDICLVTRAMMADNLASNTRVKITKISSNFVTVLTLTEKIRRVVLLPRIRFRFRMEYGQSYAMMRTQFPLRLAYAMSYNKSQSQTLFRTLVDCTEMPFTHGHLYVASSRVRSPDNIAYYFDEESETAKLVVEHKKTVVTNIVYKNLIIASSSDIIGNDQIVPVRWGARNLDIDN